MLQTRIFLEDHQAGAAVGAGHLYLVLRQVEVDEAGEFDNVYRPLEDEVIRGGAETESEITNGFLNVQTQLLSESNDAYDEGGDPDTPAEAPSPDW